MAVKYYSVLFSVAVSPCRYVIHPKISQFPVVGLVPGIVPILTYALTHTPQEPDSTHEAPIRAK